MATVPGHALFNLDRMLVAFFESEPTVYEFDAYAGAEVQIVPAKYDVNKPLPLVICATDKADRGRAKNWSTTGRITVLTPLLNEAGESLAAQSSALEFAVLKALENHVPDDDRTQPLCNAINAVATTQAFANFKLTNFQIQGIESDEDEDYWIFIINFAATVLNDSYNND